MILDPVVVIVPPTCLQVIQGLLNGNKDVYHTKVSMLQLFCHECLRVYGDRMWDPVDRQWLWVSDDKLCRFLEKKINQSTSRDFVCLRDESFLCCLGFLLRPSIITQLDGLE